MKTTDMLDVFSTRLDEEEIEKIKAYSWYKRISQRQLIEIALKEFWDRREAEEIETALNEFRKKDKKEI